MLANKAVNYYLGKSGESRKNCAQAVLCGFKEVFNISEATIEAFGGYGVGRAPEGICGALYAANFILEQQGSEEQKKELSVHMERLAGSLKCREIRANKQLSCVGCVEQSARFIELALIEKEESDSVHAV